MRCSGRGRRSLLIEDKKCVRVIPVWEAKTLGFGDSSRQGRQGRKVTGRGPSSRTDVRDLREISPFGRNDKVSSIAPPSIELRACFACSARDVPSFGCTSRLNFAWRTQMLFSLRSARKKFRFERYRSLRPG